MFTAFDILIRLREKGTQSTKQAIVDTFNSGSRAIKVFNAALVKSDNLSRKVTKGIFNLRNAIVAGGVSVFAKTLFDAGVRAENISLSFNAIFESSEAANKEIEYLRKQSDDLGLDYYQAAENFRGIAAAAKGTALEGEETRHIFIALNKASRALGLTTDQTRGSLYAIEQMISKGTVSAEELRRQLGDRLPGAFQLAAQAVGVSTQQLDKMLKTGQLLAVDLLPKLADLLEKRYGKAALEASQKPLAALNRFKNAWNDLKADIAQSGFLEAASEGLREITEILTDPKIVQDIRTLSKWFINIGISIAKFALNNKGLVLSLLALAPALSIVSNLVVVIKALNAAFVVMTGKRVLSWLATFRTWLVAASFEAGILVTSISGIVAALAAIEVKNAVDAYLQMREAQKQADEGAEKLNRTLRKTKKKFDEFKDYRLPDDLTGKTNEQLKEMHDNLSRARAYWAAVREEARQAGDSARLLEANAQLKRVQQSIESVGNAVAVIKDPIDEAAKAFRDLADQAAASYDNASKRIRAQANFAIEQAKTRATIESTSETDLAQKIVGIRGEMYARILELAKIATDGAAEAHGKDSDAYKAAAEKQQAAAEALKNFKVEAAKQVTDALKSELDKQLDNEKRLVEEIKGLQNKGVDQQIQKEDELRELRRRTLTEAQQQADLEAQATEKLKAAKAALATGDSKRAEELAAAAKSIYKGLEDERAAIAGVKAAWETLTDITARQEAEKRRELAETQDTIKDLKAEIERVQAVAAKGIDLDTTRAVSAVQALEAALARIRDKTVTVTTNYVTKHSGGGSATKMAVGGKLPGYGGGDRIPSLLEAGERVTNKISTAIWDRFLPGFMDAINRTRSSADIANILRGYVPRFAAGGLVPAAMASRMPASAGAREEMTLVLSAGGTQVPLTVMGNRDTLRGGVRALEREIGRMSLSHRKRFTDG